MILNNNVLNICVFNVLKIEVFDFLKNNFLYRIFKEFSGTLVSKTLKKTVEMVLVKLIVSNQIFLN